MQLDEYLIITIPFTFSYSFLILSNAKLLKVNRYIFTIGFFLTLWHFYEFVLFPLSAPFLFSDIIGNFDFWIYFIMLILILFYLLFFNIFLRLFLLITYNLSNRIAIQFVDSKTVYTILKALFFFTLLFYLFYYKSTYKTLNTIYVLTHKIPMNSAKFINYQVYYWVIIYSIFSLSGYFMCIYHIFKKNYVKSMCYLLSLFYILVGLKSKYVFVILFLYIAGLYFTNNSLKSLIFLMFITLLIPFLVGGFNALRGGGISFNSDALFLLLKYFVWRADFLYGFYKQVYYHIKTLDFSFGCSIFSLLLRIFPRAIWHDRPGSTNIILTQKIFGKFGDIKGWSFDFGGIGEFLYNFGPIGIILAAAYGSFWVALFNNMLIYSIKSRRLFLLSFILTSPVFWIPWNIGINTSFSLFFIPHILVGIIIIFLSNILKISCNYNNFKQK